MARPLKPEIQAQFDRNPKETIGLSCLLTETGKCLPYIYLLHCEGSDYYKVSYSTVPPLQRLAPLQSGSPFPLRLLHLFVDPSAKSLERQVHRWLKVRGHWLRGEWFQLSAEQLQVLVSFVVDQIGAEFPIYRNA